MTGKSALESYIMALLDPNGLVSPKEAEPRRREAPRKRPPAVGVGGGDDAELDDPMQAQRRDRERRSAQAFSAARGNTGRLQGIFDSAAYAQDVEGRQSRLAGEAVEKWMRFGGPKPSRQQFAAAGITEEEAIAKREATAAKNRARPF